MYAFKEATALAAPTLDYVKSALRHVYLVTRCLRGTSSTSLPLVSEAEYTAAALPRRLHTYITVALSQSTVISKRLLVIYLQEYIFSSYGALIYVVN